MDIFTIFDIIYLGKFSKIISRISFFEIIPFFRGKYFYHSYIWNDHSMSPLYLPFILLLSLSSLVAGLFAFLSFRAKRILPGGIAVFLIGFSVVIWSMCYLLEILVPDLTSKIFWANLKQIGNVLLPTATLIFALRYTQLAKSTRKRTIALLAIEPIIVLFFIG